MLHRLARALVLKYPQPWRNRYGDEVLELLNESRVRCSDLGELFRGLVVEKARALIEDADRPRRTAAVLKSLQPVFATAFLCAGWGTGLVLRSWLGPWSASAVEIGLWFVAAASPVMLTVVIRRIWRLGWADAISAQCPLWVGVVLLPPLFVAIVLVAWGDLAGTGGGDDPVLSWARALNRVWVFGYLAAEFSAALWPGRRLLESIGQVEWAQGQLKNAETWVEGCRTMIAKGVPSPLSEARALAERWTRERDVAVEQLQSLGYKARFW